MPMSNGPGPGAQAVGAPPAGADGQRADRRHRFAWLALATLAFPLSLALPPVRLLESGAHYAALHVALEVLSICVAAMVFALAWSLRQRDDTSARQLLGPAFLAVALIDLLHALSFAGMPDLVTPSSPEKAINFWLAGRTVSALALLLVAWQPRLRCPLPLGTALALGVAAVVAWAGLFHADAWPRTFVPGRGLTGFNIVFEYALAAAFVVAAVPLLRRGHELHHEGWGWLGAAAWVLALAELYFTLYGDVTDTFNLLGHVYKAIASLMVCRALFVTGVQQPHAELQAERAQLQRLQRQLQERLKERDGLHDVFTLTEDLHAPLHEQLQAVADRLPAAWMEPERAAARVVLGAQAWASPGFAEQGPALRARIAVEADADAHVELRYARPGEGAPPPFMAEEQALLDAVAARLASVIGQRRMVRALDERQAVFSAIVDQAEDSIALIDRSSGRFVEFNDAAARNLGYGREQFAALTVADIDARMTREQIAAVFGDAAERAPSEFETRLRHADGSLRDARVRARPITLGGQRYYASIWSDITERKRAERALRDSELHFRTLANNGRALIWTCDAEGRRDYFNDPWLRFTGLPAQEAGRTWAEAVHPEDRAALQARAAAALQRHEAYSVEYRLRRHDGAWRRLREDASVRRDGEGRFLGWIGLCFDVTEERRATEELERYRTELEQRVEARTRELAEAKNAAEAATRAKSVFLANMSHEIRTPLNAIIGMAHLLRRSALSAQQHERLERIDAAGELLLSIVNAVLDLSKIEAGKYQLEETTVRVADLVDEVALLLAERAQAKGLQLRVETRALPPRLRGDPTCLKQALLNYAANAVKFTDQGHVTLRAAVEGSEGDAVTLRFEVHDSGPGIDADTLQRLFTAFEQADGSTTRLYGGTGLGLALTRHLARLMGGEAGADSEPGRGSTFWFTARLHGTVQDAPPPQRPPASALRELRQRHHGTRVLVAEDEPVNQELVQILLEEAGLDAVVVGDGLQAVEQAASGQYALVLLDMQMPHLDGLDAARRIRALPDREALPVLALTANAFAEDRQRCLDAGMNDFITKPLHPERLYQAVLKWLDHARPGPTDPAETA